MKFVILRELLLKPLQLVNNIADKKHIHPVYSNLLLHINNDILTITASDLEVELLGVVKLSQSYPEIKTLLPARKLMDICRSLPEQALIEFNFSKEKAVIKSAKVRFSLTQTKASDFVKIECGPGEIEFNIAENQLKKILDRTQFAIASQDVRYYLNGLLLKLSDNKLIAVGTDGHRLAYSETKVSANTSQLAQVIVPRKGISELSRLLAGGESTLSIALNKNHLTVKGSDFIFTSKLVEGRFPEYLRVFPDSSLVDMLCVDKSLLKQSVSRISILSNESNKGIYFHAENGVLRLTSYNSEREEACEELVVKYSGNTKEIAFNSQYILDVLNILDSDTVAMALSDPAHSSMFEGGSDDVLSKYVVMPLQI